MNIRATCGVMLFFTKEESRSGADTIMRMALAHQMLVVCYFPSMNNDMGPQDNFCRVCHLHPQTKGEMAMPKYRLNTFRFIPNDLQIGLERIRSRAKPPHRSDFSSQWTLALARIRPNLQYYMSTRPKTSLNCYHAPRKHGHISYMIHRMFHLGLRTSLLRRATLRTQRLGLLVRYTRHGRHGFPRAE